MSGNACELINSTLLSDEPEEASAAHIGSGNSEIASIFVCKVFAPTTAQTMAETTSNSLSRTRSVIGVVISSAMLIDISSWTLPLRRRDRATASASRMPACRGGEAGEELLLVGVPGVAAHHSVHQLRVRADQDAPSVRLDPVQDDRRRLGRAGRRIQQKTPGAFCEHGLDLVIRQRRRVLAHRGEPR